MAVRIRCIRWQLACPPPHEGPPTMKHRLGALSPLVLPHARRLGRRCRPRTAAQAPMRPHAPALRSERTPAAAARRLQASLARLLLAADRLPGRWPVPADVAGRPAAAHAKARTRGAPAATTQFFEISSTGSNDVPEAALRAYHHAEKVMATATPTATSPGPCSPRSAGSSPTTVASAAPSSAPTGSPVPRSAAPSSTAPAPSRPSATPTTACWTGTRSGTGPWARCSSCPQTWSSVARDGDGDGTNEPRRHRRQRTRLRRLPVRRRRQPRRPGGHGPGGVPLQPLRLLRLSWCCRSQAGYETGVFARALAAAPAGQGEDGKAEAPKTKPTRPRRTSQDARRRRSHGAKPAAPPKPDARPEADAQAHAEADARRRSPARVRRRTQAASRSPAPGQVCGPGVLPRRRRADLAVRLGTTRTPTSTATARRVNGQEFAGLVGKHVTLQVETARRHVRRLRHRRPRLPQRRRVVRRAQASPSRPRALSRAASDGRGTMSPCPSNSPTPASRRSAWSGSSRWWTSSRATW